MIPVTQLRRGVVFEDDGQLWRVLEYDHYKPGRGNAIIRTKLRNLRTNATVSRTFLSGASVQDVRLDHRTVQFLYSDGDYYHFMDVETYEQPMLEAETLSDVIPYLKEGITIDRALPGRAAGHRAAHHGGPRGDRCPAGLRRRYGHQRHQAGDARDGAQARGAPVH